MPNLKTYIKKGSVLICAACDTKLLAAIEDCHTGEPIKGEYFKKLHPHIRTDFGDPYICPVCQTRFIYYGHLRCKIVKDDP